MAKRPLSVTIIAWFLIITSIFSALSFWSTFNSPLAEQVMAQSALPRSAQMAFSGLSLILNLVFGAALLKRQNWARYAYVGFGLLGMLIAFFTSPFKSILLLSGIFLAVIAFFLFRKPANDWFRGTPI